MSHTPGPWRVFNRNKIVSVMYADSSDEVIHWSGFDSSFFQSDVVSNARLAAAAPALLEACEKTCREIRGFEGFEIPFTSALALREILDVCDAAIAAARRP